MSKSLKLACARKHGEGHGLWGAARWGAGSARPTGQGALPARRWSAAGTCVWASCSLHTSVPPGHFSVYLANKITQNATCTLCSNRPVVLQSCWKKFTSPNRASQQSRSLSPPSCSWEGRCKDETTSQQLLTVRQEPLHARVAGEPGGTSE